jgi:hypothetical protein
MPPPFIGTASRGPSELLVVVPGTRTTTSSSTSTERAHTSGVSFKFMAHLHFYFHSKAHPGSYRAAKPGMIIRLQRRNSFLQGTRGTAGGVPVGKKSVEWCKLPSGGVGTGTRVP